MSAPEEVHEAVRRSGLFARDRPLLVMLSGGQDSTCLLDVAVTLLGAANVGALHVNYGLRADAEGDEQHCRALCERLGVALEVLIALRPTSSRGRRRAPGTCRHGQGRSATPRPAGWHVSGTP